MNDRFFLDTNIFVYSFDSGSPQKAVIAAELIQQGIETGKGTVSYQVVQEFVNVALRLFESTMSQSELEEFLFEALFPMTEISSSSALVLEALRMRSMHRLSWYDSLIVAAAIQSRCKILYSEDLQDGRRFGELLVRNPFL